jgi:hypothetical protein
MGTFHAKQVKEKRFFFEKKNQKTFASLGGAYPERPQSTSLSNRKAFG